MYTLQHEQFVVQVCSGGELTNILHFATELCHEEIFGYAHAKIQSKIL